MLLMRYSVWLAFLIPLFSFAGQSPAVAFYYGDNPPMHELRAFDWVVVDPGHLPDPKPYTHSESQPFAYISLGEVTEDKAYFKQIPKAWLKGENKAWQSQVIDQSAADWPKFALEKIVTPLWESGYRAFFLDTLDSFNLIAKTNDERKAQIDGLLKVIALIKSTYPDSKLIFNRGFELLPQALSSMDALAFESWFSGYDASKKKYNDVTQSDRDWLASQIEPVRNSGIPVIAIDYVPEENRDKAREVAKALDRAGFIPWVSNPDLSILGVGAREVRPRRILMVTPPVVDEVDLGVMTEVTYPTTVLNAMGYAVDYAPINKQLPAGFLADRYAGLLLWVTDDKDMQNNNQFTDWLLGIQQQKLPMLFVGDLNFLKRAKKLTKSLSLKLEDTVDASRLEIVKQTQEVGYETPPVLDRLGFYSLSIEEAHQAWLTIADQLGNQQTAIAITSWGGLVVAPYAYESVQVESAVERWVVNPYKLFEQALKLTPMPMPDTTTESGKRLLMVHHDGDGFASRSELPGAPYASKVMLDEIVKKYAIPMSISVIEGEVGAAGIYPEMSPQLESIARKIYSYPHVEIASHTYSHPFDWAVFSGARAESKLYANYNMTIPNYTPNLAREIEGSIAYINRQLTTTGKSVALLHWSGDCNPTKEALAMVEKQGLPSINGGNTVITLMDNSLTQVSPVGINKNGYFQVYAPIQNENVFTNDWTGPFNGYKRVLETFQLTEQPKRIKPVNIYFHTFALSKYASMQALKSVFDWAIKQPLHPIHASEFVRKASEFNRVVVAKSLDNQWVVRGLSSLQELRIPTHMGYPDLVSSDTVVGFNDHLDQRYLHVVGEDIRFYLTKQPANLPYLIQANASVTDFKRHAQGVDIELVGYVTPKFELALQDCKLSSKLNRIRPSIQKRNKVNYGATFVAKIQAICRP
ncbi:MAG: endo alpha-1,4 polygalactosaminidase [Gammaproteobacteria bacterium]|nr:endo alpha-1,4 polygalactosaminidase [Gammaproteobacteria bacterium]